MKHGRPWLVAALLTGLGLGAVDAHARSQRGAHARPTAPPAVEPTATPQPVKSPEVAKPTPVAKIKVKPRVEKKDSAASKFTVYQVFDRMLDAQDKQEVLSCNIERTEIKNYGDKAGKAQVVSGTLRVRRGGWSRLELTQPAKQLMVSDGKVLWMELPEVGQVYRMSTKQMKKSGNFFLDLGGTIRFYSKNSLKRLIPPGNEFNKMSVQAIEILPDDPERSGFNEMKVWVDIDRWVILRAQLKANGVNVGVKFENIVTHTRNEVRKDQALRLSDEIFKYKPPEDFELFDLDF